MLSKADRAGKFLTRIFLCAAIILGTMVQFVSAATQDLSYPAQLVKISVYGGERNLNISGYGEGSALNTWNSNGSTNEQWRIDYVSSGVFKIVNVTTDKLVSAENNSAVSNAKCVLLNDNGSSSQMWNIVGVQQDFLGNDLYYKISNYANPDLVISYNTTTNAITLKTYTGANNQKWKLNCDGLDGFAGNCLVQEGEKAGTIGGLLGETVYVSNLSQLKSALLSTKPLTIVITANIDDCNSEMYDLRIEDNKTIIGSYGANRLTDPRLRTDDYFKEEAVSNNIVIKNINFNIAEREDVVAFAVYGSRNIWIDHCSFNCSLDLYYDEVGKFIWVNRCEYASLDPDFVTISYNEFNHRFWGIAFGAKYTAEDRASAMYNKFTSVVHRAPQLGNGTLHVLNNSYYRNDSTLYNDGYASIKCGAGSAVYSDSNRFVGYRKESSGYWDMEVTVDSSASFIDHGSYTNKGETPVSVPYKLAAPTDGSVTTWSPSENYGYSIVKAYGNNDITVFCDNYSGAVKNFSELHYINHEACSNYIDSTVISPVNFAFSDPDNDGDDTVDTGIVDGGKYMIKNVNSGLYLDVAGGAASNGTNVQQWGASSSASYNTWKAVSVGNGYYQLYSQVGDGNTYLLDVADGNTSSGTNIRIWQNTFCDAQVFKLEKQSDGSYAILTKITNNQSGLDVESGSKSSGANVQQWGYAGGAHQKWIFEKVN